MVEVVDLTLTDDEDDVAVDNRDEEVVEVVVNREVRGAAGAANRVDDDDEVMVTGTYATGHPLSLPSPRRVDISRARSRRRRFTSMQSSPRSISGGRTGRDARRCLRHAPLLPSNLQILDTS